jgi:hypothetical protein
VFEDAAFLRDPAFEDAIVRLAKAYRGG